MFDFKIGAVAKLTLAASLLFAASCASHKPPERGGGRGGPPDQGNLSTMGFVAAPLNLLFASMDADQDGYTSIDELNRFVDTNWAIMGLEEDSQLRNFDYQSWATIYLGHAEAMPSFIGFDTDLSGSITQLEFETCLRRNFDLLDKDKNGTLNRSELLVKMPSMRSQSGGGSKQRSSGGKGEGGGGKGPPR